MNNQTKKEEFDRSTCFSLFWDHYEMFEKITKKYGDKVGNAYIRALMRYGLLQEEPEDEMIDIFLTPSKDSIDKNQKKRAKGFESKQGENMEQTKAILEYIKNNPTASQRQIADTVGVSKGKVQKVTKKYSNEIAAFSNINTSTSDSTSISNSYSTSSSYSSVSVSVSTDNTDAANAAKEDADASKEDLKKKKKDSKEFNKLDNLPTEDLQYIVEALEKRTKQYKDIQNKFNLEYGSVNYDTIKTCREIINQRTYEANLKHSSSSNAIHFSHEDLKALHKAAEENKNEDDDNDLVNLTLEMFS